jgi:ribosomal protein S27AE
MAINKFYEISGNKAKKIKPSCPYSLENTRIAVHVGNAVILNSRNNLFLRYGLILGS